MDAKEMSADGLLKLAQEKIKFEHDDHKYELHERDVLIRNLQEQVRILRVEKDNYKDHQEDSLVKQERLSRYCENQTVYVMFQSFALLIVSGLFVFFML